MPQITSLTKPCEDCPTEIPARCKRCKPCAYKRKTADNLRRYHANSTAGQPKPCVDCHRPYTPARIGPARYCDTCRRTRQLQSQRAHRARNPAPRAPLSRPCPTCGVAIPRNGKVYAAYCSDECKPRCTVEECDQPQRKRTWCGSHYVQWLRTGTFHEFAWKWSGNGQCAACPNPAEGRAKCCSFACYFHLRVHNGNPPSYIVCVQCGEGVPIGVIAGRPRRKRADTKMCRRCRQDLSKYGISVHDLVDRDGPDCGICGVFVDLTLRAPDPGCPSVDHKIPRAAGGTNNPENLQLAHLRCNIVKHDKLDPEPM